MTSARIKSLETRANASRAAFGFDELDYEARWRRPAPSGWTLGAVMILATGALALAHRFGWTGLAAAVGAWRTSV